LPETCREKQLNILRKFVHQVGSIRKIMQGRTVNKTKNSAMQKQAKLTHQYLKKV